MAHLLSVESELPYAVAEQPCRNCQTDVAAIVNMVHIWRLPLGLDAVARVDKKGKRICGEKKPAA